MLRNGVRLRVATWVRAIASPQNSLTLKFFKAGCQVISVILVTALGNVLTAIVQRLFPEAIDAEK